MQTLEKGAKILGVMIDIIKFINYRRFQSFTINPNKRINILVGDNEVGKSSILDAINLVALGSVRRVESIGLQKLINISAIEKFQQTRNYGDLPKMTIELYLTGDFNHTMNGKNNSLGIKADGIRLICAPNEDYLTEINDFLSEENSVFPYEYLQVFQSLYYQQK